MGCESLGFGVLRLALVFEAGQQPRRRFIFWLVVASLLSVSFLFQVQRIGAQERVRIAPSSPGLAAWPMHLGAKEGFFAREGLSPEIIVMRTNTGIAALVTGSVDFTTAGGSAMRAAVNGAPVKMILNVNKKADLWIVAQKIFSASKICAAR